jgi:ABC-2 type transport system ATP-binding protein
VIAEGTAEELKLRIGGEVLSLRVADRNDISAAAGVVLGLGPGGGNADNNTGEITLPVGNDGTQILTEAVRRLDAERIRLADIGLHRPSLGDVFLSLTGHVAEQQEEQADEPKESKRRRRKER